MYLAKYLGLSYFRVGSGRKDVRKCFRATEYQKEKVDPAHSAESEQGQESNPSLPFPAQDSQSWFMASPCFSGGVKLGSGIKTIILRDTQFPSLCEPFCITR